MLCGNYRVLNRSPGRFFGGSTIADSRSNFNGPGASRNFAYHDGSSTALPLASTPDGTEPPYSWIIPQKGGALSSTTRISGVGEFTASNLAMGQACDAALAGSGDIVFFGDMQLIVSMAAGLTGTGDVTLASLNSFLNLAASLTGSGDFSSAILTAKGFLAGGLTGTGDVTLATINGPGSLSAAITVTGDLLTTANVAEVVWQRIIDAGYTAEQVMKLLGSVNLGKSSGMVAGSPSVPVFKGLDGSTTRVSGLLDADGNRTAVTLNPA